MIMHATFIGKHGTSSVTYHTSKYCSK